VPGASKTVLEARIPYGGGKSMAEILGKEPETYACTLTAVEMARAAYRQAAHLSEFGVPILGVSCTCALATDRVKRGDHKVLLALSPCAPVSNAGCFSFIQQFSDHMHPGSRPHEEGRPQCELHLAFLHLPDNNRSVEVICLCVDAASMIKIASARAADCVIRGDQNGHPQIVLTQLSLQR